MHTPALQPMAYVCVVSGFNLPELESCLTRRPSDVLLVTSDRLGSNAQRLQRRLEAVLPEVRVHVLHHANTGQPLGGDDVIEGQQWITRVLCPYLQRPELADLPHVLNFTGGTKAMGAALLNGHTWQQLDYKALGKAELQVLEPLAGRQFTLLERRPLTAVSPVDVASLHADDVYAERLNPVITDHPTDSLRLAQAIWQAQADAEPTLLRLFESLERLWVHRRNSPELAVDRVRLDWAEFLAAGPDSDALQAALTTDWLPRLQILAPDALHWDAAGIELPGNAPGKARRYLRDWISGTWLEQLAYQWLLEAGLPERAIARNLKSATEPGRSGSQREADLLVHHRGDTRLVEIKAGLPPGHAPSELEKQVSSLGHRFGQTRKALLIGPQLRRQLQQQNRWESFGLRCGASSVDLLANREELLAFVGAERA